MKKIVFLSVSLLIGGASLTMAAHHGQPRKDAFPAFWQKFKAAVLTRDKKAVAALTRFPIGVSNGAPIIQSSAELSRRFSEVFDQDTNAAQCFAKTEPTADTESPDRYTVTCPNKDDNFVVYEFERTQQGWKFIHRQFPTKCGCR
jgi:hypothetical protein